MDMPTQQPEPSEATGNRLRRKVTSLTENQPSNTIGALWILLAGASFAVYSQHATRYPGVAS